MQNLAILKRFRASSMAAAGVLAASALLLGSTPASAAIEVGSGTLKTETRTPGNFTKIETSGSFELEVTAGQPSSVVTVSADDDMLPDVKTTVSGDVLSISTRGIHFMGHKIVVKIGVPKLSSISASGANRISASNLAGDSFTIEGSGSTKAILSGKVDKLVIDVSGAGHVEAMNLAAKSAEVDTSGAGHVEVNASDKLSVRISGAGKVIYLGNPSIDQSVSGAGKIVAKR